ncbi:MAG: hypothetical protein CUN54_05680 [Phototrophicales bacterium]|nr:MAG: hypothetical protein CUN54_05680 [Phototrophicales bacterium]
MSQSIPPDESQSRSGPLYSDDMPEEIEVDLDAALAATVARSEAKQAVEEADDTKSKETQVAYRGATNDPTFGYIIALGLSLGLIPLIPESSDLRYTILWMILAGFAVLAWLLGRSARIAQETPENLGWGITFGLILGGAVFAFGGSTLRTTVELLFVDLKPGTILAYLVFVMPLSETLFFRGVLQEMLPFWLVGLLSSLWSVLLFFPLLDVGEFPVVAVVIGTTILMANMLYSYVRERNGLAAAWLCQIVVNIIALFLPTI